MCLRDLANYDGEVEISTPQAYGVAAFSAAKRSVELGQRANATAVDRVQDVSRAETGLPGPAVLIDARYYEPLDALIEWTAALDFDDSHSRQLRNSLSVCAAHRLQRRNP